MHLTCPTCQSGLEVPDGTTAHVRCPACRTVFAPAAPAPPPAPPPPPRRKPAPVKAVEEAPPVKAAEVKPVRAVDGAKARRRRDEDDDGKLTPAEKRARRAQFDRAAWGARLVSGSFVLQAVALLLLLGFLTRNSIAGPLPALVVVAGLVGGLGWVLGAVGVALCLSGPPSPGHYQFGAAAAVAVVLHALLLAVVLARASQHGSALLWVELDRETGGWGQVPTKLDNLTLYLASAAYRDNPTLTNRAHALTLAAGVAELVRLVLVGMLLSCLARAAGDEELAHRCTRAAGIGSFGPGALALGMLLLIGGLTETGGIDTDLGRVVIIVFVMGVYAILAGVLVPTILAARDTTEACEEPYQSEPVNIGDR